MIGEIVSQYQILEKLGAGENGVVYKAEDRERKRIVAVKSIHKKKLGTDRDLGAFESEAQATTALDHPAICAVHGVVDTDEHMLVVTNFVIGQTLERIVESGPLDLGTAFDYAVQIAEGLQAAHENGIVHRDLKAANVMVTRVGGVKITDIGLCGLPEHRSARRGGLSVGTVAYLAPEQLSGGEVDRQADLWSLGVILYEMVAGRLPFTGSREAVVNAIRNQEPKRLSAIRSDTPEAVETIVAKALAKNWEDRYHTAGEMLADLLAVQTALRAGKELPVAVPTKERVKEMVTEIVMENVPRRVPGSRRVWYTVGAVAIVALAALIFFSRGNMPFAEHDWVVVADFDNLTGEPVFEHSLDRAMWISLAQSPYVNPFTRRRTEEALSRMEKEVTGRIDGATALEIARHDGIKVAVAPTIVSLGGAYKLSATISSAETGEPLRSHAVRADAQADVLDALDELARWIRGELGESGRSISRHDASTERAVTASLVGLEQYAAGYDSEQHGALNEARKQYARALKADSAFTLALASLGTLEWRHFDHARGIEYLRNAMELADETTERESYAIRAAHALAVDLDVDEAVKIYKASVAAYPDAVENHTELATLYNMLGRHEAAADAYKEAIRAEPTMTRANDGLAAEYLDHLGRVDSALVWLRKVVAYRPGTPSPYYWLAYAYVGADSLDNAAAALERAVALDPSYIDGLELLGHVRRMQGRYRDSAKAFDRQYQADKEQVAPRYYMGVAYELAGDRGRANDSYDWFRRITQWRAEDNPDNGLYSIELALVLTRVGQTRAAASAANRAAAVDSTSYVAWARLRAVQGRKDDAVALLQRAVDHGFRKMILLKYHPDFAALRKDPRVTEIEDRYLIK